MARLIRTKLREIATAIEPAKPDGFTEVEIPFD
jgi:hypothetical protein